MQLDKWGRSTYFEALRSAGRFACSGLLALSLSSTAWAQLPAPQWKSLDSEQRQFLLDAFQLAPEVRQSFSEGVPDEIKQGLLNSLWSVLTPEKRVQVALYAHIEKPFGDSSEATAKVVPPSWEKLSKLQRFKVYEAARMDATGRAIFEGLPPDLRQGAFEAIWSYMDPKARQRVMAR